MSTVRMGGSGAPPTRSLPSSVALAASASRLLRERRCFSSSRCFSALASSQRPFSIRRWSGRRRLSVGAVPLSGALSVSASSEK